MTQPPLPFDDSGFARAVRNAKIKGGLSAVFGSDSVLRQMFIWGVLQNVIGTAISPLLNDLTQFAYSVDANVPLSADAEAGQVARGITTEDAGKEEAAKTGVAGSRFERMVTAAGHGPAAGDALTAHLRGLIGTGDGDPRTATLTGALADAGIRKEWWPILEKLAVQVPSYQQALNADLQGQLTREQAMEWYVKAGGDPDAYQWLYDSNGQAPTPTQALELLNRGIIPKDGTGPDSVSYQQAFLEGPWRNKWLTVFEALAEYLPPPRTVTAMVRAGSLDDSAAAALLRKQGLSAELAAAYIADAHHQATSDDRALTQAQIIALYGQQIINGPDASALLEALGYSAKNAGYLLALADLRREITALNSAVSRVQSLYVGHKINRASAVQALNTLGLPADQVAGVVQIWDLEASVSVKALTESQIGQAWKYTVITTDQALQSLQEIGYTARDAWIVLSIDNKGPLPHEPKAGPAEPLGTPG